MTELVKAIFESLKALHPQVYFLQAASNATPPYLVFDCQVYDDGEGAQFVDLDIDGWDDSQDVAALETLMKNVNDTLNKKVITTDTISVVFYLEKKLALLDGDPELKRRKYIYAGKLFKRS